MRLTATAVALMLAGAPVAGQSPDGRAMSERVRGASLEALSDTDDLEFCLSPSAYVFAVQGSTAAVARGEGEESELVELLMIPENGPSANDWTVFLVEESGCFRLIVTPGGRARVYRLLVGVDW